eukprot:scpid98649/ scgid25460/ 
MASQLSCLLGRNVSVLRVAPLTLRFQGRRFLCSSSSLNSSKQDNNTGAESASTPSGATTSASATEASSAVSSEAGIIEAVRNVKPANADEYAVKASNDLPADVAAAGTAYSESMAYRLAVADANGRTEEMALRHRKAMRVRYVVHTTLCVFIVFACFIIPGSEEIDDVTGDVYRRPPGYVDLINDIKRTRAYLRGTGPPEPYAWP